MKIDEHTQEIDGYTVCVSIHHDEHTGEPWKEHDGHGLVSDWTHRDKQLGELVLCSARGSRRYYDFSGTLEVAKRDGWGLGDKDKSAMASKLGRKPTAREIRVEAVQRDYEYLRGWCNDEWHWLGYITQIETPTGQKLDGDSCWGYDDLKYMIVEAMSHARHEIEKHKTIVRETAIAEAMP